MTSCQIKYIEMARIKLSINSNLLFETDKKVGKKTSWLMWCGDHSHYYTALVRSTLQHSTLQYTRPTICMYNVSYRMICWK